MPAANGHAAAAPAASTAPRAGYLASPHLLHVPPGATGEFGPLVLGQAGGGGARLVLDPPLLMAPMAGLTSAPLRRLCVEHGAAMATSEMVVASALALRNRATLRLADFHPAEALRSVQVYGVRPDAIEAAVRWLVEERGVHHADLNFGCPVRKVTSRGGGAALPLRPRLFASLVAAAVRGAGGRVPVTVKMRVGLSQQLQTFVESGRIAEAEGASGITLHARCADQPYTECADWGAIARLAAAVQLPVVGNGGVWESAEALQLMRATGAAGVMVGRAALGRPWLFGEIRDLMQGRLPGAPPTLARAAHVAGRHLRLWAEWDARGAAAPQLADQQAMRKMRKCWPLYLRGFATGQALQQRLLAAGSLAEAEALLLEAFGDGQGGGGAGGSGLGCAPDEPFPTSALRHVRLKSTEGQPPQRVALPQGWLDPGAVLEEAAPAYVSDAAAEG